MIWCYPALLQVTLHYLKLSYVIVSYCTESWVTLICSKLALTTLSFCHPSYPLLSKLFCIIPSYPTPSQHVIVYYPKSSYTMISVPVGVYIIIPNNSSSINSPSECTVQSSSPRLVASPPCSKMYQNSSLRSIIPYSIILYSTKCHSIILHRWQRHPSQKYHPTQHHPSHPKQHKLM